MASCSDIALELSKADLRHVKDLTLDSRQVRPGSLFMALPGTQVDGSAYAKEAAEKGAVALLISRDTDPKRLPAEFPHGPKIYRSAEPRRDAARIAAQFYPLAPRTCGAVTGTNGKTSVVWFARQLLQAAGVKTASIGTLGLWPEALGSLPTLTSPDPISLHKTLQNAAQNGFDHLLIEASSHGLDQHRLDGLRFAAAAFTNLSRDHLDYHKTPAAYRAAKLRLADLRSPKGRIITNADDPAFAGLAGWSYGYAGRDGRLLSAQATPNGLRVKTEEFDLELPLIGPFQAHNLLCAWLMTRAMGTETDAFLDQITAVPGRMEVVAHHRAGGAILVDYAHTPAALDQAMRAARAHTLGRLICVFGAGGDRDQGKRPLMGRVAYKGADQAIVTDDNPRHEPPARIREAILASCPGALQVGDRRAAIAAAIEMARPGDLLLIAGKGHETGQDLGATKLAFNDKRVAQELAAQTQNWQVVS